MKLSDYMSPTAVQKQAMDLLGTGSYIFYGGARGGGKSWMALAAAVRCAISYPGLNVVIIRKTYSEIEELFINELISRYPPDVFGYVFKVKQKVAVFDNGSRITFRSLETKNDAQKIQGLEYQLMIIDEAPNFPEHLLKLLFASCRSAKNINFKATVLMTGNPGGISHLWFKTHFVDRDYTQWSAEELEQKEYFKFIPARIYDNPYLDREQYIRALKLQDPGILEAWLNGDWSVYAGQFFDSWSDDVHVIEPFKIPRTWNFAAGLDLGYTDHPTVCLWGAQDPDTGNVYIFQEYTAMGVAEQYIDDIKPIYDQLPQHIIWADPSIWGESKMKNYLEESVANMFIRRGLPVMPASNSRVNGWRIVKQWLFHTPNKPPKLHIFNICTTLIDTLPILQYTQRSGTNREDLDTTGPDDAADALRYMLVSGFGYPDYTTISSEELTNFYTDRERRMDDDYESPSTDLSELEAGDIYDPRKNPYFVSLKSYYL